MLKINKRAIISVLVVLVLMAAVCFFWYQYSRTKVLVQVVQHQVEGAARELEHALDHWDDVVTQQRANREVAQHRLASADREFRDARSQWEDARSQAEDLLDARYRLVSERIAALEDLMHRVESALGELKAAQSKWEEALSEAEAAVSEYSVRRGEAEATLAGIANRRAEFAVRKLKDARNRRREVLSQLKLDLFDASPELWRERNEIIEDLDALTEAGKSRLILVGIIALGLSAGLGLLWYQNYRTRNS